MAARVGGPSSPESTGWRNGVAGGDSSGTRRASRPAGHQGSAGPQGIPARRRPADRWPTWARPQLEEAIAIGRQTKTSDPSGLAAELRRRWYAPEVPNAEVIRTPLGGLYRRAHAGSARPILADGVSIVDRNDVIGRDGWWRTWSATWTPTTSRTRSTRILLSPRPDALAEFVGALSGELLGAPVPWLLACAADARLLRRAASAMLYVPDADAISPELIERLAPMMRPVSPPLCLPLAPGIALSENPDNGMSFGAHRCQLIALGLHKPRRDPLRAIADAFAANGVDPASPHRSARS